MTQLKAVVVTERYSPSDQVFIAVLLDHYIAARGETALQAISNLRLAVEQTITANQHDGQAAFTGLRPAPQFYHDLHASGPVDSVQDGGGVGGFIFEINGRQAPNKAA